MGEDAFTLEIFAECFYEMLQRDFCYEIYRALESANDPEVEKKKAEIANKEKEAAEAAEKARLEEEARLKKEDEDRIEAERKAKEEAEKEEKTAENGDQDEAMETTAEASTNGDTEKSEENSEEKTNGTDESKDDSDETEPPSSKRIKSEVDTEVKSDDVKTESSGSKEVKQEEDDEIEVIAVKKKMVSKTVYPQLLLAFSFFDRSFSGYIKQRDLEDCVDSLGLGLSKSQLKYLVGKVAKLDLVNYQDMTDEKVEEGTNYAFKYHSEIPLGNSGAYQATTSGDSSSSSAMSGDFVQFQGSTINLKNVMQQADQLQSENNVLQSRVTDLEKDNGVLKSKYDDEAQETAFLRKKLGDTKATLTQTTNENSLLTRTQESLKRLMKDNVYTLDNTMKQINKKLEELEPPKVEEK